MLIIVYKEQTRKKKKGKKKKREEKTRDPSSFGDETRAHFIALLYFIRPLLYIDEALLNHVHAEEFIS